MRFLVLLFALLSVIGVCSASNATNTFGIDFTQVANYNESVATTTPIIGISSFSPRFKAAAAVIDDTIWLIGGYKGDYSKGPTDTDPPTISNEHENDVHISTDSGSSWTRVTENAEFSPRYAHGAVGYKRVIDSVLTNVLVVVGGAGLAGSTDSRALADAWVSYDNGFSWNLQCFTFTPSMGNGPAGNGDINAFPVNETITPKCPFQARSKHALTAKSDGTIILSGGASFSSFSLNDVWRSTDDGKSWVQVNGCKIGTTNCATVPNQVQGFNSPNTVDELWGNRYDHATIVSPSGKLVVTGGNGNNNYNDVWVSSNIWSVSGWTASGPAPTAAAYATWELKLDQAPWFARLGHGMATITCLNSIIVIGGDALLSTSSQDFTTVTSLNDVWGSTDDGASWTQIAENGNAGVGFELFSKREYFFTVTTTKSLVVGSGIVTVNNGGAPDTRSDPFYGDVWASTFAQYNYGDYGSCDCANGSPDYGKRTRLAICAAGLTDACCADIPKLTQIPCKCYKWSPATFITPCPVTCGGATQIGNATCTDGAGVDTMTYYANLVQGTTIAPKNPCDAAGLTQPSVTRPCNTQPCPICAFSPAVYGQNCTNTCGGGLRIVTADGYPTCLDQNNLPCPDATCYAQGSFPDPTVVSCNTQPCPQHVIGDPEFLGFQGQKYEIHGVPDQVFNIITSPLMQYNALFVYIGKKSKNVCNKTRTHPWTHAGTYLGSLGFKTVGGDRITMDSGSCVNGIKSVKVNGDEMEVGQVIELTQVEGSGVTQRITMLDEFTVKIQLAEVTLTLTNSDHFFNQNVAMTAYGEEKLQLHGLLGQTWRSANYIVDGVKRVIEGTPTDYLVQEENVLGDDFAFNKFPVA